MKSVSKRFLVFSCWIGLVCMMLHFPFTLTAAPSDKLAKANAAFDAGKMADMSDFDPSTIVQPTGDTIKIAIVASFSGPAAMVGQIYWLCVNWAAHDINKRGGIVVDGKKKLIQVIKADHMSRADQCKKVSERMILQEKVNVLLGTDGGHLMKIINETANKYKTISVNIASPGDDLMDATNFSRYAFYCSFSAEQVGRGLAYYYGQIRKKEKKFYILCQDYSFGRSIANGFKTGLKEYYPEATIIGEDYHKLFLTDYLPFLTKIKASEAEVIFTGDWNPDAGNLLKQARQSGIMVPFANIYMDDPSTLTAVGVEGTKGLTNLSSWNTSNPHFKNSGHKKVYKAWTDQWKNHWKTSPYNSDLFAVFGGNFGSWTGATYWLLSVMERAKSTDPEKIIGVWEDDTYKYVNGKIVKMRACDHKIIQDLAVSEFVPWEQQKVSFNIPPFYWYKGCSSYGPTFAIPAEKVLPWKDSKLDRCKNKNGWGE